MGGDRVGKSADREAGVAEHLGESALIDVFQVGDDATVGQVISFKEKAFGDLFGAAARSFEDIGGGGSDGGEEVIVPESLVGEVGMVRQGDPFVADVFAEFAGPVGGGFIGLDVGMSV